MKTYTIEIIILNGQRVLTIHGFVLSRDKELIKKHIGDINRLPLNKKIKVTV